MSTTEPTYTITQIRDAINNGADLVGYSDKINLIVNAQLTLLERPEATLDDVILANWQAEGDETDEELIARVKSWSS